MKIALLWFDNSKDALEEKIDRAVQHYTTKFGRQPNMVVVHPSMTNVSESKIGGVELRTARAVMPNHFWVGVEDQA